jgi:hypothetical protein
MSERKNELEDQLSETASELSTWRSFIEHAGWARLCKVLENQAAAALEPHPLEKMDQILEQEFKKGSAFAFRLIRQLPDIEIQNQQNSLERLQKEIEYETENGGVDSSSGGRTDRRSNGRGGSRAEPFNPDADPFGHV